MSFQIINEQTIEKLAYILQKQALLQREVEYHKVVLNKLKDFVLLNAFQRIAQASGCKKNIMDESDNNDQIQFITSLDLIAFFKQNQIFYSEADCFLIINQYDQNNDGRLSLQDFQKLILPEDYSYKKLYKNSQKYYTYGQLKPVKLSYDCEISVLAILQKEIEVLQQVEKMKQELISFYDWSAIQAFRTIDEYSHGKINSDNLRCFFRNFSFQQLHLQEEDINSLVRKYDRDGDRGWNLKEFINACNPLLQYSLKAKDLNKVILQTDSSNNYGSNQFQSDQYNQIRNIEMKKENQRPQEFYTKVTRSTAAITTPTSQKYQNMYNSSSQQQVQSQTYQEYAKKQQQLMEDEQNQIKKLQDNQRQYQVMNDKIVKYPYEFEQNEDQEISDNMFQDQLFIIKSLYAQKRI